VERWFQSLIHQGKNARMKLMVLERENDYKNGFNPLFIRGKMQA